ncbi:hypothetical protein AP064_02600 [Candidatus Liberibacter solanacearum]|uniref:Uncharacterized protein n=1 Tax=Candidatus Liberibacter solanacearum TaxID=556287 RepID=A0A0F4VL90_9HYPH|nr:hypothetical protein [Candidatus Liberibacter solanacearum]KJZ82226.1 hypothetical protein DJ66_0970 [Candidatus Liberibacter solanacearum]KQC49353.1 hypothetical protein AP064_02600 [Candidatus Liberibacter solanacearum]
MHFSGIDNNITPSLPVQELNNALAHQAEKISLHPNPPNDAKSLSEIENPSSSSKIGETAKEALLSLIPVYGTIQSFKKGEIGWGIFGAITDVLTLVPVVGYGAKMVGALARGGNAAIKISKVGAIAASATASTYAAATRGGTALAKEGALITKYAMEGESAFNAGSATVKATSSTLYESNVITKAADSTHSTSDTAAVLTKKALSSKNTIKTSVNTAEMDKIAEKVVEQSTKKTTLANKETIKQASKKFLIASIRAVDPGLELLYNGGKAAIRKSRSIPEGIMKTSQYTKSPLTKSKWKNIDSISNEYKMVSLSDESLFQNFKKLNKNQLDQQFLLDLNRAEYIIDGKNMKNIDKASQLAYLQKTFANDPQKLQIISSYAHQGIFAEGVTYLMEKIPNMVYYGSKNGKSTFTINTLGKEGVRLSAKYTTSLVSGNNAIKKPLREYGLKIDTILSPNKAPQFKQSFYTKE